MTSGFIVFLAMVMSVLIPVFNETRSLQSLSWFAFSLLPFLIVVAIASFVRVQQQIDLKSGFNAQDPQDNSKGSR